MTDDLVAWLMATLDDVEREARAAEAVAPSPWAAPQWESPDGRRRDTGNIHTSAGPGHDLRYRDGDLWDDEGSTSLQAPLAAVVHIAGQDPAVVLAGVEADRAIIAEHESRGPINEQWSWSREYPWCVRCSDADEGPTDWPCRTILLVASRYRHRPGYREEWKP